MKLEKIIIEGFRGYNDRTEISIDQLTAFIGENDVGKSTILEALDAFFNDVVEAQDLSTRNEIKNFTIGCIFSNLPEAINLDAQSTTSLNDEYLLNQEGKLELYKVWRVTATKAEVERIFAKAYAPMAEEARDLLFKKRDDLKNIIDQKGLESDRRRNPDMRMAIYRHLSDQNQLNLQNRDVDLDRPKDKGDYEDARKIWIKLRDRHLPVYTLFKSEQVKGDKESAVRTPLDTTLKNAIKLLDNEFKSIAERIEQEVKATTDRTLDRLRKDYPEVARSLVPEYKTPSWSKAFDLNVLRGDDDVPLNKRGAGIRRLVVLAFFQAEAEKKREEKKQTETDSPPVIYGIEEPETSQHPNFQRSILEAFETLAQTGDQVLLTTHVPGLAELLPINSIRFIDKVEGSSSPRIRSGEEDQNVLMEAANSLGVFPSVIPTEDPQIAIWVEGDSDVWVIEAIAKKLEESGILPDPLDRKRLFFVFGGGGDKLKSVVNGKYLDALGLPQFYLRDSDKEGPESEGKLIPEEVLARVSAWEERNEGLPISVVKTKKREIENYLHYDAVDRVLGGSLGLAIRMEEIDLDFTQISKSDQFFWTSLQEAKYELGLQFPEKTIRGVEISYRKPKHVICGLIIPEMTLDEIRERCRTTDEESQEKCEIETWFENMARLVQSANG